MSQPVVKWGQAERYFLRHGYQIKTSRSRGGEKMVIAPSDGTTRGRNVVRVGHTSCAHQGSEILRC
jgi:hypothetical protein